MYAVSPYTLNLLQNCPRCFWLSVVKKLVRPSTPMPSIVNRFDGIVKEYFNKYRTMEELPTIITGQVKGRLPHGMPSTLRHVEENRITLWGRPDDYLELEDGATVPFDHKTRAGPPSEVHAAHRLQMDVYSYLVKMNGYKTVNKALIGYYFPSDCELHNGLPISCTVVELTTDPNRVKNLLVKASDVLNGSVPAPGENCGYCRWADQLQYNTERGIA
jgi:hypothetical protein